MAPEMIEQTGSWETRIAEEADSGERLDKWLSSWTELSRSRIRGLVETGNVRAGGDIIGKVTTKVRADIEYAVRVPPPVDDTPQPEDIPLDILFEDDHLIVLNKSSGMTVHPAPGSRSATLVNALLFHCADSLSGIGGVMRPGIVHRLDKDTSGVMVAAKTDKAHQGLSKQFAKHSIDRIYTCLVRGAPKPRSGRVTSRLARSPHDRKKQAVVRGTLNDIEASDVGRHAVTHYRFVKGYGRAQHSSIGTPKISQIDCQLETGRTHQIRVHLPILAAPYSVIRFTASSAPMPHQIRRQKKPYVSLSQSLNARPSMHGTSALFTPSQKRIIASTHLYLRICSISWMCSRICL